jgi:hypothetical protein
MNIYNNITIVILIITIFFNYLEIINVNSKMILLIIIINRLLKKNIYEQFTELSAEEYKEVIPDDIVPEIGCTKEYPYRSVHDGQSYCYNNSKCTDQEKRINEHCGTNTRIIGQTPDPPDEGCSKAFPYRTKHPDDSSQKYKYCYNNKKCTTPEGRPEEDCGSTTRKEPPDVFKASDQWVTWYDMSKEDQVKMKQACDAIKNTVFNIGNCTQLTDKEICEQEGGTFISGLKTNTKSTCEKPEEIFEKVIECCECVNPMDDRKLLRLFGQFLNGDSATIPNKYAQPLSITRRLRVNGNIYVKGEVRMVTSDNKLTLRGGYAINGNNKELLQIGSSGGHNLNVNNNYLHGDNTMSIKDTFKNTNKEKIRETFMFGILAAMQAQVAAATKIAKSTQEKALKLREANLIKETVVEVANPGFTIHDFGQITGKVGVLGYKLSHKLDKNDINSRVGMLRVDGKIQSSKKLKAKTLKHDGSPGACYIYGTEAKSYMDCGHDGQWRHQTGEWFPHID